jgi:pilus assembly protein CpaE
VVVVVNRYDKNGAITIEDIRTSLSCGEPVLVPNDFATVSRCIDAGTPLLEEARNAAITRAVMTLETRLGGTSANQRRGLLARTFSSFTKSRPA